ncbi:MAG: class III cytochrome C family protein [Blastomonas sp.]|nr:class III cytochrome C family protein [Blastomonas sp.]
MMRRWALWLIAANLCGLLYLTFAWPDLMVAPGPVISAHGDISSNCFACHAPFTGVAADRCAACHKVADIGIRTTKGTPIAQRGTAVAFHQALTRPDCVSCHTDHSRPHLTKAEHKRFDHSLLRANIRGQCASCHRAPPTHLHRQAGKNCAACHGAKAWKPSTFNHSRFFALTGPHKTACATCHTSTSFERYTCYGCHEHKPAQIRAEHAEEGIRNIENCVRCHRSDAER